MGINDILDDGDETGQTYPKPMSAAALARARQRAVLTGQDRPVPDTPTPALTAKEIKDRLRTLPYYLAPDEGKWLIATVYALLAERSALSVRAVTAETRNQVLSDEVERLSAELAAVKGACTCAILPATEHGTGAITDPACPIHSADAWRDADRIAELEAQLAAANQRAETAEREKDRLRTSRREAYAACAKRAEERDSARGSLDQAIVEDITAREDMARALGMSWDGCDPFEWPEIIARANENTTTLKALKARATAAEERGKALDALGRQMAGVIKETWVFAVLWAEEHARDRAAKIHDVHAGIIARIHAAVMAAHAAGYLPEVSTSRLPGLLAEHGHDIDALSTPAAAPAPQAEDHGSYARYRAATEAANGGTPS